MLNIVFTAHTYYPNKDGVQMVTQYMAEGLAKLGHNVTVIAPLKKELKKEEIYNNVQIKRFVVKTKLKHSYGQKKEFQEYLVQHSKQIDVLITVCSNTAFAAWTYPIIKLLHCKKIMYQHGMYDGHLHLEKIHSYKRLIKQLILTPYWEIFHKMHWKQIETYNACVHLFENDSSYKYFRKHGFEKNVVIMNSCELELFQTKTQEDLKMVGDLEIHEPYFLYVANYCTGKNQLLALEEFYQLEETNVALVFVGSKDNAYVQELKERKKKLDRENRCNRKVYFFIGIPRRETVALIRECYACLMTSNNEYLPITIIEAMACDKPFISTNVGVVAKLPGGVIANDKEDIQYWLKYFLNHEDVVNNLGNIAGEYVRQNMFIDDKIKQLETLINEI